MCSVRRNLDGLSPRLYLPVFAESVWKCCTVLSCTRTTLTPTRPPTQTCLGTHIDCSVPSEHMHAETPTQSSYEPSHLMFMHQPQSRLGKPLCGIISNLLPLYVGGEYVNGRWFLIPMCASSGWKWRCSALGVSACVCSMRKCVRVNLQVRWALTRRCCLGTQWLSRTGPERRRNGTARPRAHSDSSENSWTEGRRRDRDRQGWMMFQRPTGSIRAKFTTKTKVSPWMSTL